jgi:hypothetical protein
MWLKLAIAALLKWPEAIEEWAVQTFKSERMSGEEYAAAMVAVIRKFDGRPMMWNHHQISHKWQHCGVLGPVALMQALGMLNEDTFTAPEVLHLDEGQEGTGKQVYGLLANHTDIWNRLVELADSTQTIAAPQAEEEIEGFIANMGVFVSGLQSSFGMGSMKHQSMPDQMKTYTHTCVAEVGVGGHALGRGAQLFNEHQDTASPCHPDAGRLAHMVTVAAMEIDWHDMGEHHHGEHEFDLPRLGKVV